MFKVIKNYKNLTCIEKSFLFIRYITAPFVSLCEYFPRKGLVLDIGCGPGLLESHFVNKNKKLFFVGVDPDKKKIQIALKLLTKKARFINGYLNSVSSKLKFDCISLIDVEYLLDISQKKILFKQCINFLKNDGTILLKTNDNNGSIGFKLGKFQELLSLKLGITKSNISVSFLTVEQ